jgi:hypothetical protein
MNMDKPSSPPEPPLSANTNGHHENDEKGHHGDISHHDSTADQGKVSVRPKMYVNAVWQKGKISQGWQWAT